LPDYTPKMQRALKSYPGALRALALVQADQHHLAEEELRHIHPGQSDQLKDALLAFAADSRLPAYQMRFASLFKNARGSFYDAALYPIAPWKAEEENADQNIDDAVLNAFIRQESRFRSGAHNPSGATGLMQIMPDTANYVMGTRRYSGAGAERLKDPALNMKIGERYIHSLLQMDAVNYNLFYLAVAYNAGPGNLRKWRREQGDVQDPLFFIETIPVAETRAFVERVMHNLWVYRLRMGQPVTSLDYVASGEWPSYIAMDGGTHHVASMRPKHTGIPQ
jgi:soluble lytic murein transglycosylase-like protein